ncbi:FmdB family zinc ribbon protein [Amycolatopsis sp. BJA-103]|uniref:FmdB family zinc ribbon protein n=1 Tax=unclassified Amycolatopsis TaxID=2618356 RepID=UPI000C76A3FC|nr:FmdB family zinc ribbon protein [Amycolatopsis sp. BJA-103]AUI61756.1 FmdB family transcriptional regulator [Amycolatopsis sp. BJA-103]PNE20947.1 FmdB family transcriptional regulator [Amycolatopsis sp. BJA-103]
MPTYQYACKECDHAFEAVQSFSDASLTVCPQCSGPLRKVFSSVGVVFKGSGFYRNDSRDSKANTTSTSAKTESKSESKTESKPESKSETKSSASSSTGTTKTAAAAS